MPLKGALVDRARAVYQVEDTTQPFVEGQPPAEQQTGEWFACRLTVQQPTESRGMSRSTARRATYHRTDQSATLLIGQVYEDGSPLTSEDRGTGEFIAFVDGMVLQVESEASADEMWIVAAGVEPIRKKRKVIGFSTSLRRSREPVSVKDAPLTGGATGPPLRGVTPDEREQIVVGGEPGL